MADAPAVPFNLDAEESVLGAMLISPAALAAVTEETLHANDFYRQSHADVFIACLSLYAKGEPVDAVSVTAEFERTGQLDQAGGTARIHELAALVPAAANARHYARLIREQADWRGLIRAGNEIARHGYDRLGDPAAAITQAEHTIFDLAQRGSPSGGFVTASDAAMEAFTRLQEIAATGKDIVGVPTGFKVIDRLTSGLHPGNLILVAARPSMGKSSYAFSLLANVTLHHDPPIPAALFTLEMNKLEVMNRLYTQEALVDSSKVQSPNRLGPDDWSRIVGAADRLSQAPLLIDDSGLSTFAEIASRARRLLLRRPDVGLVVIDYVQLLTSGAKAENRTNELSQISRGLKNLARELNIPIVVLSQLSREVERRHDKRPMLVDLRESGSLEQDADVVMLLYRDEYYNPDDAEMDGTAGVCEVNVAKQRNGPTGMRKLAFSKRHARFSDMADET